MKSSALSRRDFLKLTGIGLGALAFRSLSRSLLQEQFPSGDRLGRVLQPLDLKAAPNENSASIKTLYEDTVVQWLQELVGPKEGYINQRWVETPEGYIYASFLQPVRNQPNQPLSALPDGSVGFWAEVTVPYVDLHLKGQPAAPWVKDTLQMGLTPRLYYSQVAWIDQVRTNDSGKVQYRFNESADHGWGYGDVFWVDGAAFRPLTADDVSPISPDVDPKDKKIVIDRTVNYQTLSCFEGNQEVYFCRVSTGTAFDAYGNPVDKWLTPLGAHNVQRKAVSIHMAGGTTGNGFDTAAVSWTSLFDYNAGVAIHAAFWHNDFGVPRSHGCVNCRPEDAKWIFRWTMPVTNLDQSDITLTWPEVGTEVDVKARTVNGYQG
jgi:lipoprotein-anchoring transpeptidase ErfK/SrfK